LLLIKIIKKILTGVAAVIGITAAAMVISLQSPSLQNKIVSSALKSFTKDFDGNVSIGKVYYIFFNDLIINDLNAVTSSGDTVVSFEKLSVSFSAKNLLAGRFRFRSIYLSGGKFKLIVYPDSTTSISKLFGNFQGKEKKLPTKLIPDIRIRNLKMEKIDFSYINLLNKAQNKQGAINFSDISLKDLRFVASGIRREGEDITADLKEFSFSEKSGFRLTRINSSVRFGSKGLMFNNLSLADHESEISAEELSFEYSSLFSFGRFTDSVRIKAILNNSFISLKTIGYFAPSLQNNNLKFYAKGLATGTVNNFRTENLYVTSESGVTSATINARISGLPRIEETMAFVDIDNLSTTTPDLDRIIRSINPKSQSTMLAKLSPFVKYNFSGRLAGLLTDFVANGNLTSNIGNIYMDVLLKESATGKGLEMEGKLTTDNFNLGELLRNKMLGEITLSSHMSALLRDPSAGGSGFYIDSISIKKLEFNNYAFSNIYSVGSYVKNRFDGRIISHDPNLDFIFQGVIDHSSKEDSYYDFYADVVLANLSAINLDTRDSLSVASFRTLANFTRKPSGDILGNISVKSLEYQNRNGNFEIGDISVQSYSGHNNYVITLNSPFADARYTGSDFLTTFFDKIISVTGERHIPSLIRPKVREKSPQEEHYNLELIFHDTRAIAQMVLPGLVIADKSSFKATLDKDDSLSLSYTSAESGYEDNLVKDIKIRIASDSKEIKGTIENSHLLVSGIEANSGNFQISSSDDIIYLRGSVLNGKNALNTFNISSDIKVSLTGNDNKRRFDILINPVESQINNQLWKLADSRITIQDSTYTFEGFSVSNQEQHLKVDGIISPDPKDLLNIQVEKFDLSPFNIFLALPFPIDGNISGKASVSELFGDFKLLMDLEAKNMSISSEEFGNLYIQSRWNGVGKNFEIALKNKLGSKLPMVVDGKFWPGEKKLDISAKMDSLKTHYFEPIFTGILSGLSGSLSGDFHLFGSLNALSLHSENAVANQFGFLVDFTNVKYEVNGPVLLTDNGITVNNATITDRFGNRGRVNGGLNYKHFRNIGLNLNITVRNMECLNTLQADNSAFYGTAFGSGRVSISGPFNKVLLDISMTTNKNTEVHIPLESTSEAANSDLLRFVSFSQEDNKKKTGNATETSESGKNTSSSDLIVRFKGNITPDAALMIEIDKSVGDVITGYGTGLINIDVQPSRDLFNIQGDYIIESGSYKFVLQGLFNRDFTIQEGGNIGFNGDIMKTNLNITANYRTKASINTLISDTTSVSSRRNVDCLIKLTGPLLNPKIGFDIQIPDLDPLTKSRVDAALNTEDKIVKQVMSLLVSGSFIPDIQSSIVNNSTILYSNATEILSNQINNIFKQLDIPLDLSFNYQPGQNGRDLFDAAVSAQLFDNRVIVNGNIGNSRYMNRGSNVVGDLEVEIKLDEEGRFRAKAFSHSADQYTNYLDNSQRNGIGIVYQEEFSTFSELINSLFLSRSKRDQISTERENRIRGRMEVKPRQEQIIKE